MIKIELDSSVETLCFGSEKESEAIHKALMAKGIMTVEELCRLTKSQFSKAFQIDVDNLILHLSKVGLHLGMNDRDFATYINDRNLLLKISNTEVAEESDDSSDIVGEDDDFDEEEEDDKGCLVTNDYETGEQLMFSDLWDMYQYFDFYISKLRKDKVALQNSLTAANEALERVSEKLDVAENNLHKQKSEIDALKNQANDQDKRLREERVYNLTKEEFLRSKCIFKTRQSRLKEAIFNAMLLVNFEKEVFDSFEKDKNKKSNK